MVGTTMTIIVALETVEVIEGLGRGTEIEIEIEVKGEDVTMIVEIDSGHHREDEIILTETEIVSADGGLVLLYLHRVVLVCSYL